MKQPTCTGNIEIWNPSWVFIAQHTTTCTIVQNSALPLVAADTHDGDYNQAVAGQCSCNH